MKRKFVLLLLAIVSVCCLAFGLAACGEKPETSTTPPDVSDSSMVTITFDSMGGTACASISQNAGTPLTLPTPTKDGYDFVGWYTDTSFSDSSSFTATVMPSQSLTLYAKWNLKEEEYTNEYISAKNFYVWNEGDVFDVEEKLIIRYNSEQVDVTGKQQYNLNTGISIKQSGYNIIWYADESYTSVLGTQRDYLEYGDNIYFATVVNSNGQFICAYAINIYVLHDYVYTYYEYQPGYELASQMGVYRQQSVRESVKSEPINKPNNGFEFVEWVTYQSSLSDYGAFNWNNTPTSNLTFYATYSDVVIDLGDSEELQDYHFAPYSTTVLPTFESTKGNFFNGYWSDNEQFFDEFGNAIKPISSSDLQKLQIKIQEWTPEHYFEFSKISGGYSVKLKSVPSYMTLISIPAEYNGESVITVEAEGFKDYTEITEVIVPQSVTSIGLGAFSGCSSIESITIPFVGATLDGTENVHFGYIFGYETYNSHYKADDIKALRTVVVTGCTTIGEVAFLGYDITTVVLPDSLITIGKSAFEQCASLTSVNIPKNVTSIGSYAFSKCSSLITIEISNSVKYIGSYAFQQCSSMTNIVLSDGLETIEYCAFKDCSSLTSIVIPDSVTTFETRVFDGCDLLTIYCKSSSQPSSWSVYWNYYNPRPVYWAGEWHYENGVPTPNS